MIGWIFAFALPLLPFAGRGLRNWYYHSQRPPILAHACGRNMPVLPGATVLETLRANGIAHASVCGGRARCTTCRIMVTKGLDELAAAVDLGGKSAVAHRRLPRARGWPVRSVRPPISR